MSLSSTWVLTGAAPWFWPLTNLVGPYGMMWLANVETSSAAMSLGAVGGGGVLDRIGDQIDRAVIHVDLVGEELALVLDLLLQLQRLGALAG